MMSGMFDVNRLAQPTDVVMGYRFFLRREPENDEVIELHLRNQPTFWQLMQRFIDSLEYELVRIDKGCLGIWRRQDARNVDVQLSQESKAEILAHVEKIWSAYGVDDPYYSVITDSKYRAD